GGGGGGGGGRIVRMSDVSRHDLEAAIRAAWALDTCDPVDAVDWSAARPSRGQCGSTALVIHDLLGGELLIAEVVRSDGSRQGVHYWNLLPTGPNSTRLGNSSPRTKRSGNRASCGDPLGCRVAALS